MRKIYHLSTCNTCQRIIRELGTPADFQYQDIKSEALEDGQLDELARLAGSYEALFSKRARLYKERNLKDRSLGETDYRDLILEHYTFLKRPVVVIEDQIFIGNAAKTVAAIKEALAS